MVSNQIYEYSLIVTIFVKIKLYNKKQVIYPSLLINEKSHLIFSLSFHRVFLKKLIPVAFVLVLFFTLFNYSLR